MSFSGFISSTRQKKIFYTGCHIRNKNVFLYLRNCTFDNISKIQNFKSHAHLICINKILPLYVTEWQRYLHVSMVYAGAVYPKRLLPKNHPTTGQYFLNTLRASFFLSDSSVFITNYVSNFQIISLTSKYHLLLNGHWSNFTESVVVYPKAQFSHHSS